MVTDPASTGDQDLEPISKSGNAPETRLTKASAAYNILKKLIKRDQERDRKRAKIQGQIDGKAPYNESKLKQLGQGNRSNVNFRGAEAARDARKTSYYELLLEVETLVEAKIEPKSRDENTATGYEEIIAEEFTAMLVAWDGFWYNTFLHQEQFVTWGIGNCYWEDELNWQFKAARVGGFLVPDETESNIEDFDVAVIRRRFKQHELFKLIKDEETEKRSAEAGWNVPLVKQLLIDYVNKSGGNQDNWSIGTWSSLQQKIKDNDLEFTYAVSERIPCANLLIREYNGKITHVIIPEDEQYNKDNDENLAFGKFLFQKIERYDSWNETVCLFFANIAEGTYHGSRGIGAKVYAHSVLSDRLMNTTIDGAIASATIMVQPANESQKEKVRMVRVGPISVMPSGYNVIEQRSFKPDLKGLVGIEAMLQSNLNRNIGLQRPDVTQNEKTPQALALGAQQARAPAEAKLEKSDINIYYIQWDKLYDECKRRALNPDLTKVDPGYESAKAFIDACVERGVPRELLKADVLKLTARRSIGYGSPLMKSLISADILSVSPYFDDRGKHNAVRDYVTSRAGYQAANRYIPRDNRNNIPSAEHSHASLENNDLQEGSSVIVGVDQMHIIHLIVHMQPLVQLAEAYNSGAVRDIERLHAYFAAALSHIGKHLDFIAGDPARANEYETFRKQFEELARVFSAMESEVNQIQQARQQQAEEQARILQEAQETIQSDDLKVKLAEIQADLQIRMMKEQGNQSVREAKAIHGMQIKEMLARHQVNLESAKALS